MAYYCKQPDLALPDDRTAIWRYLDWPKYQLMLQKNSIFFSRADKQTDKLEGEYPTGMLNELENNYGNGILTLDNGTPCTFRQRHIQKEIPSRLLSCWTMCGETKKLWTEYTHSHSAVAIRSTIARFKNCFYDRTTDPRIVVNIGKIRYGEVENEVSRGFIFQGNFWLFPFFAKKECFRWEQEIRAIVNIARARQDRLDHNGKGCFVRADLDKLIDSILIHPQAPAGCSDIVRNELDCYGFVGAGIYQSSWSSLPSEKGRWF